MRKMRDGNEQDGASGRDREVDEWISRWGQEETWVGKREGWRRGASGRPGGLERRAGAPGTRKRRGWERHGCSCRDGCSIAPYVLEKWAETEATVELRGPDPCPLTEAPRPTTRAAFHSQSPYGNKSEVFLFHVFLAQVFDHFSNKPHRCSSKAITGAKVCRVCLLWKWPATQDFNYHPLWQCELNHRMQTDRQWEEQRHVSHTDTAADSSSGHRR